MTTDPTSIPTKDADSVSGLNVKIQSRSSWRCLILSMTVFGICFAVSAYFLLEKYPDVSRYCDEQNIAQPQSFAAAVSVARFLVLNGPIFTFLFIAIFVLNEFATPTTLKFRIRCGLGFLLAILSIILTCWISWTTVSALQMIGDS